MMQVESNLDETVEKLQAENERLKNELKSARRQSNSPSGKQLINILQHDIRTPLVGIIGVANIIKAQLGSETLTNELKGIIHAAAELLAYCNQTFTFFDDTLADIQSEPIVLNKLLDSIFKIQAPAAKSKDLLFNIDLKPEVPKKINSDVYRLRSILVNLISNAIKFTETGQITLSICRSPTPAYLEFSIRDTGIGIPDSLIEYLSDDQLEQDVDITQFKGFGFGLKIVKQFVHELQGSISIDVKPNVGSVLSLSIPINAGPVPLK